METTAAIPIGANADSPGPEGDNLSRAAHEPPHALAATGPAQGAPDPRAQLLDSAFADGFIAKRAAQMASRRDFRDCEYDDLRQQMLIELWRKAPKFDPARGPEAVFITVVINTWVRAELRRRRRLKRGSGRADTSLSSPVAGDAGEELTLDAVLSQADLVRKTERSAPSDIALLELLEAVRHALGRLHPDDRALAEFAVLHGNEAAAEEWSRRLDRPVTARWVRESLQKLRRRFEFSGFCAN